MDDAVQQSSDTVIAVEVAPPDTKRDHRTQKKDRPKREPNYHVIIWNDEVHTYEYVIELLMKLFGHSVESAYQITKEVDTSGRGIAWTTHMELAELKRDQILAYGGDWRMAEVSHCSIRATIEAAPD